MKLRGILAISLLFLASACSSSHEKADAAAAAAQSLYQARQFEAARQEILKAVRARDDQPENWLMLGRLNLETGRPADALLAYSRVLELDATNMEAILLVAELSFQFGNVRDAIKNADQALALDPASTRALLVKGLAALARGREEEAMAAADAMLKIEPADEFGLVLRSRALAASQDLEGAVAVIENAIPPERRTEASLATLAELYRRLGESEKLVATIDRQIARRPDRPDLRLDLAEILYKAGAAPRARTTLYALLRAHPDDPELTRKISDLWTENDANALSSAQLMQIVRNGSHASRLAVARYLLARDRPDLAEPIVRLEAANSGDASAADAKALHAATLYRLGRAGEAREIVDAILREDTNNIEALLVRGRMFLKENDLASALADAQIIVRDFPTSEEGRILLSDIFVARKDPLRARKNYEDAIRDIPQGLEVARSYTVFLMRSGDSGRAIGVARTFARKSPSLPKGWDLLANICKQAGDTQCVEEADQGRTKAQSVFTVDTRPGSARTRGLYGKL